MSDTPYLPSLYHVSPLRGNFGFRRTNFYCSDYANDIVKTSRGHVQLTENMSLTCMSLPFVALAYAKGRAFHIILPIIPWTIYFLFSPHRICQRLHTKSRSYRELSRRVVATHLHPNILQPRSSLLLMLLVFLLWPPDNSSIPLSWFLSPPVHSRLPSPPWVVQSLFWSR